MHCVDVIAYAEPYGIVENCSTDKKSHMHAANHGKVGNDMVMSPCSIICKLLEKSTVEAGEAIGEDFYEDNDWGCSPFLRSTLPVSQVRLHCFPYINNKALATHYFESYTEVTFYDLNHYHLITFWHPGSFFDIVQRQFIHL